jgi:hypothetical protein
LGEAIDYVKTELMPDFDFDAFNHDTPYEGEDGQGGQSTNDGTEMSKPAAMEIEVADLTETPIAQTPAPEAMQTGTTETTDTNNGSVDNGSAEVVEKW